MMGTSTNPNGMSDKRFCYFIPADAEQVSGGFIPSAVHEGEPGHSPMKESPGQAPWAWGPDRKGAEESARCMNERMGLTKGDVDLIIVSSMLAGNEIEPPRLTGEEFQQALIQVLLERSALEILEIAGVEGWHEIVAEHFKDELIEQALKNRSRKETNA